MRAGLHEAPSHDERARAQARQHGRNASAAAPSAAGGGGAAPPTHTRGDRAANDVSGQGMHASAAPRQVSSAQQQQCAAATAVEGARRALGQHRTAPRTRRRTGGIVSPAVCTRRAKAR
ncbi:hypothetical protein T440DRAFT_471483 [Plenodomus tracheiphilus IPT5]|uniref:Uncharacterized protein n=1 Tax=Plenodomus tracheiphilus IPT5 TaxID=1408161 RepID=A0A6A7AV54_9PLEO|nr:hypothetical protein T440DRAFT_471483 [Plenodomus tracheiphilus IPT5]